MGPKGALGCPPTVGRRPLPLGTATLAGVERGAEAGLRPRHPCPSYPGVWRKGRNSMDAGRGLQGARGCRSAPRSQTLCRRAGSKLRGRGDAAGAAEPWALGLLGSRPVGPTVHGRGGRPRQEGGLSRARSHPSPNLSRTDPHWAPEGSNCPAPSRGPHQPFETSKAQAEVSEGGGESESMTLGRRAPPKTPL